jgi:hypothetical protein
MSFGPKHVEPTDTLIRHPVVPSRTATDLVMPALSYFPEKIELFEVQVNGIADEERAKLLAH